MDIERGTMRSAAHRTRSGARRLVTGAAAGVGFAILTLATACSGPPAGAADGVVATASPIEGAWRIVRIERVSPEGVAEEIPVFESHVLYGDGHYSSAFASGEEPRPYADVWPSTDAEKITRMQAMTVNSGTYEVTGSVVRHRPLFALVPSFVGGWAESEFEVTGDTLRLSVLRTQSVEGVAVPADRGARRTTLVRIR